MSEPIDFGGLLPLVDPEREVANGGTLPLSNLDDEVVERPYLSIGEVLEVLKAEFDGLSIAQVRDLESRGLFTPERTASGYRKFYESDLGRLRDLLARHGSSLSRPVRPRIGGRAERTGGGNDAGYAIARSANDRTIEPGHRVGPSERLPGDPEHRHPAAAARRARAAAALASLSEATEPARGTDARRSGASRDRHGSGTGLTTSPGGASREQLHRDTAPFGGGSAGSEIPPPQPDDQRGPNLVLVPPPVVAAVAVAEAAPVIRRNPLGAMSSGVSMSLNELSSASGLSLEQIHELESQSLIRGKTVFSETYYDEDALLVANLSRKFLAFGIEPRHLRMFRLTAEREAAFYEQLVTPMLRRRNPEARTEAMDALARLLELGEQLRAVAVRHVLRTSIER
jgi:MerR family regulatory protein